MVRPKLKLIWPDSEMGGTDCQASGPELMMPSVPGPVTKPRLESDTGGSVGWPLVEAARVKSRRGSFAAGGPVVGGFGSTPPCARLGGKVPKFPTASRQQAGLAARASSQETYPYHVPVFL